MNALPSLYEISLEFSSAAEAYQDAIDGGDEAEIEQAAQVLDAIGGDLEEKSENYAKLIAIFEHEADEHDAVAATWQARVKEQKDRAGTLRNRAANLRTRIQGNLVALGKLGEKVKFQAGLFVFSLRKQPEHAEIEDTSILPPDYLRFPPPEPDKKKILDALKNGESIPGCELKRNPDKLVIK